MSTIKPLTRVEVEAWTWSPFRTRALALLDERDDLAEQVRALVVGAETAADADLELGPTVRESLASALEQLRRPKNQHAHREAAISILVEVLAGEVETAGPAVAWCTDAADGSADGLTACRVVQSAVEAEREACAKMLDREERRLLDAAHRLATTRQDLSNEALVFANRTKGYAAAIRARSKLSEVEQAAAERVTKVDLWCPHCGIRVENCAKVEAKVDASETEALHARIATLTEALKKQSAVAFHRSHCPSFEPGAIDVPCTCGYDEAEQSVFEARSPLPQGIGPAAVAKVREALEVVTTLGVECVRDGRTCPAIGCDCASCHAFAKAREALALLDAKAVR